jgi:hypothetical protein
MVAEQYGPVPAELVVLGRSRITRPSANVTIGLGSQASVAIGLPGGGTSPWHSTVTSEGTLLNTGGVVSITWIV